MSHRSESDEVEMTLQKNAIHQQWHNSYRTIENESFHEVILEDLINTLNAPMNSTLLDAGCGPGVHSIRFAKQGFLVTAVDFSDTILKAAEANLRLSGQLHNVKLQHANILSLPFQDESFEYILCSGTLMHIPEINKAIVELERVLTNKGFIVITEINMLSIQAILIRNLKKMLGKKNTTFKKTAEGIECWTTTSSGRLLTRQTDMSWLRTKLIERGFTIKKHTSSQFTELYTKGSCRLFKKMIHCLNYWWYKNIKSPSFAFGNILIAQKQCHNSPQT